MWARYVAIVGIPGLLDHQQVWFQRLLAYIPLASELKGSRQPKDILSLGRYEIKYDIGSRDEMR